MWPFNTLEIILTEARRHQIRERPAPKALFRSKNFLNFDIVSLSFLFNKHYLIMEQLGLKDSSRDL